MVKQTSGALLLSLRIDPDSERPINSQLCDALRDLMLSGGLKPGERLPASRTLAADLGVSRTTVIDAFQRLTAEGTLPFDRADCIVPCRRGQPGMSLSGDDGEEKPGRDLGRDGNQPLGVSRG